MVGRCVCSFLWEGRTAFPSLTKQEPLSPLLSSRALLSRSYGGLQNTFVILIPNILHLLFNSEGRDSKFLLKKLGGKTIVTITWVLLEF